MGIFGAQSPERTIAEREARHAYTAGPPGEVEALRRVARMLAGGELDMLLSTLRARWLDRSQYEKYGKRVQLTHDIECLYVKIIEEVALCDKLYYADDPKPKVTDAEYDELIMHLIELERVFPQLIVPHSPTQNVAHGAAARAAKLGLDDEVAEDGENAGSSFAATVPVSTKRFPQHRHLALMLSLDNAYHHNDLVCFYKRAFEAGSALSAELKIDGVALSLEYRHRKLFLASTRGTGRIGDEVTDNIRHSLLQRGLLSDIPDSSAPDWLIIRGEVFIPPADFCLVNAQLEKPLSNPRNAAAGALKHKDPNEVKSRMLKFIAYECLTGNLADAERISTNAANSAEGLPAMHNMWPTQSETLTTLSKWGFGSMPKYAVCANVEEAEAFAVQIEDDRDSLEMGVDGIVFKFENSVAREAAGHTARAPRGAIAYKFAAQARVTIVQDVVMQVSRNGVITPVAVLKPVRVGGAVLSRATLHNFEEIKRLGIAIGDHVRVERGGDVIPKVIQVEKRSDSKNRKEVKPPRCCPSCGGELIAEKLTKMGPILVGCKNSYNCTAQTLGRLIHFSSRDAMEIIGLGKKTAEKLVAAGIIIVPADLFRITMDDLLSLDGFATVSAARLFEGIQEASTSRSLERVIIGLGLPGVGQTGARALALKVSSLNGLLNIGADEKGYETIMSTANMAEKTALNLHEHLQKETTQAELVSLSTLITPRCVVDEEDVVFEEGTTVDSISGKSFVFTGKFVSMNRPAVMKWIKKSGGRVSSDVSRKTDFLISGLEPGNKFFKAQRIKVKILQEAEVFEYFNISPEAYAPLLQNHKAAKDNSSNNVKKKSSNSRNKRKP